MGRVPVRPSGSAGFTLLEILVAVFIMAMVLTFAFQAYQGIEHAYSRVGSSPSRDRAARIVLDRLERELVGSVLVQRADGADPLLHPYFFYGDMKPYAESEGDTLRFVTRTPLRAPAGPPVGLEIVTYGAMPSQSGPGLVLLRQAESLPPQLAKDVVWNSPDIVVDNVALFLARYTGEDQQASETWDSTGAERLDQLPSSLVVTVSLWETDAAGQPVQGPEFSRTIDLPVRPFKLSPDDATAAPSCGEGMTVQQCIDTFTQQISQASSSLATAIHDAQGQVKDTCWNPDQPSPALQRLKVLMGGIPGFDSGECK
jgi:prepilin-type N-terminal cleavage/methylation domain-containing protein